MEPSKRKNAWRGLAHKAQVRLNTGVVLANCHQSCTPLPARAGLVPRMDVPRVYTAPVVAGGGRKACLPSPADATLEKRRSGYPGAPKPTRNPRRGQRLSWNQTRSLTAKAFFLLDRARPVLFLGHQKENGGCIPAGKAGTVPAPRRRDPPSRARGAKNPRAGVGANHAAPPYDRKKEASSCQN